MSARNSLQDRVRTDEITIVVSGCQGSGKPLLAQAIQEQFPGFAYVDEWNGFDALPSGAVVTTNVPAGSLRWLPGTSDWLERFNARSRARILRCALEDLTDVRMRFGESSPEHIRQALRAAETIAHSGGLESLLRSGLPNLEAALHGTPDHPTRTA